MIDNIGFPLQAFPRRKVLVRAVGLAWSDCPSQLVHALQMTPKGTGLPFPLQFTVATNLLCVACSIIRHWDIAGWHEYSMSSRRIHSPQRHTYSGMRREPDSVHLRGEPTIRTPDRHQLMNLMTRRLR